MKLYLILFFIFISCSPRISRRTTETVTSSDLVTTFKVFNDSDIYFWYDNKRIIGPITINADISDYIYLRGNRISNFFLSGEVINSDVVSDDITVGIEDSQTNINKNFYDEEGRPKVYCMKIEFSNQEVTGKNILVIPAVSTNEITSEFTERYFTLDLTGNSALCKDLGANETNDPAEIISPSFDIMTSDKISLYDKTEQLTENRIDLTLITLKIDPTSNIIDQSNSCTNDYCANNNYNCCINDQCVNDGTLKRSASGEDDYAYALKEVALNPNAFVYWPNIYNVCGQIAGVKREPLKRNDALLAAHSIFNQKLMHYYCMEGGKQEPTNFTNCCLPDGELCDEETFQCLYYGKDGDYSFCCDEGTECEVYDYNRILGSVELQEKRYDEVKRNIWIRCGCTEALFDKQTSIYDDMAKEICSRYELELIYRDDISGISDIECKYVQEPPAMPLFEEIPIPGNTVPHLFFSNEGELLKTDTEQTGHITEGVQFEYFNPVIPTTPISGNYNMNAILGSFTNELNRANPAIALPVELGRIYMLTTSGNGMYYPCYRCSIPDAWEPAYTAFPISSGGRGSQASGFTTSRLYDLTNIERANYEDMIYNRACFVPPTMIPLSHMKMGNLQDQRLNRLKTQATLYINGYQRDWYGFNKGAVIGSFNGVNWFAIGSGRRVEATGDTLYLAINGIMGDLASPSESAIVTITEDSGEDFGFTDYDYDPSRGVGDPGQNAAASCQSWHVCSKDYDCVSKLGWEYMCADISQIYSHVPTFNYKGEETANSETSKSSLISNQFILNYPGHYENNKRCVYRGRGAPCKKDFTNMNSTDTKVFTCAPNFYCADLNSAAFTTSIARELAITNTILFGKESDVTGRPKDYMNAITPLDPSVIRTLRYNFALNGSANDFGICLPGKDLSSLDYLTQHQSFDLEGRTDYISQVGSCNALTVGNDRVISCPIFNTDSEDENFGNYIFDYTGLGPVFAEHHNQNMCGASTLKNSVDVINPDDPLSPFHVIEQFPLKDVTSLIEPTMARDACLRRAGSICHTDIECAPNFLHKKMMSFADIYYFGRTEAEQRYWEESLICGQKERQPRTEEANLLGFDMSLNRCCRDLSQTFTMYTDINQTATNLPLNPELSTSVSLDNSINPAADPSAIGRYSRYITSAPLGHAGGVDLNEENEDNPNRFYNEVPSVQRGSIPLPFQWKTLYKTGSSTCCGGGWIRKFADGTHDWTKPNRLKLDLSNFQCLNYYSRMVDAASNEVLGRLNSSFYNYNRDYSRLCSTPHRGGCIQLAMKVAQDDIFKIEVPTNLTTASTSHPFDPRFAYLDTSVYLNDENTATQLISPYTPYQPTPYKHRLLNYSEDIGDPAANFISFTPPYHNLSFYLPIYIGGAGNITQSIITGPGIVPLTTPLPPQTDFLNNTDIKDVYIVYKGWCGDANATKPGADDLELYRPLTISRLTAVACPNGVQIVNGELFTNAQMGINTFCINQEASGALVMHVRGVPNDGNDTLGLNNTLVNPPITCHTEHGGVIIGFNVNGNTSFVRNPPFAGTIPLAEAGMNPGSVAYYLSKLGRLELLGIPQIFYEPIYCNNDRSRLIPDLYHLPSNTAPLNSRAAFEDTSNATSPNSFSAIPSLTWRQDNSVGGTGKTSLGRIYHKAAPDQDQDISNPNGMVTFMDKIALDPIFSGNEFVCCAPLGSIVQDSNQCCSNHGIPIQEDSPYFECKLKTGTNLHVYFNKFVSSEGMNSGIEEGSLVEQDFIPETGEPKLTEEVNKKLATLGATFCEGANVRSGAAFGYYYGQPNEGALPEPEKSTIFSIVDSPDDYDEKNKNGALFFVKGYKWNHHYYCSVPSDAPTSEDQSTTTD